MILPGADGKDHINVYSKGKTEIGKWLSNFAYSPFKHELFGNFISIEGLWYWLKTGDNNLRLMKGFEAKQYGKAQECFEPPMPPSSFQEYVKQGLDAKLRTYMDKTIKAANLNLPLCHYYMYGDKKVDAGHDWVIEHIEKRLTQTRDWVKSRRG